MLEKRLNIILDSMSDICEFEKKVIKFKNHVNIVKGSVVWDAKAILGIFYIMPLNGAYIEILSEDELEIREFNTVMSEFVPHR